MSDFEHIKRHIARKCHKCWLCEKYIYPKEKYVVRVSKFEGDFSHLKFHEKCFSILEDACLDFNNNCGDYSFDRRAILDWYINTKCSICEHNNYKCSRCKGLISSKFCKERYNNICKKYSCSRIPSDICYDEEFIE